MLPSFRHLIKSSGNSNLKAAKDVIKEKVDNSEAKIHMNVGALDR